MAMKELFFEGKTIEAAVEKAAEELGQDKDLLSYTVEETPTKGIFGIGATPAKIRVEIEIEDAEEPVKAEREQPVKIPQWEPEKLLKKEKKQQGKAPRPEVETNRAAAPQPEMEKHPVDDAVSRQITAFISGLLPHIGAAENSAVKVERGEEDHYFVEVSGSKMGVLIGRRGETLDAVQYLCGLVVNKGRSEKIRITVDTENYRAKRVKTLESLARKNAEKAIKYKRNITMEPMSPYERRIIHAALTDRPHITTYSVGSEPRRRVVVSYKK